MYKNNSIFHSRRRARQGSISQHKNKQTVVVFVVQSCYHRDCSLQVVDIVQPTDLALLEHIQPTELVNEGEPVESTQRKSRAKPKWEKLDKNEEQIMKWRKKGLSKQAIAERLGVSYGIVNNWMKQNNTE